MKLQPRASRVAQGDSIHERKPVLAVAPAVWRMVNHEDGDEVGDDHYYEVGNDGDDESEPEVIPSMRSFQSLLFRPEVGATGSI